MNAKINDDYSRRLFCGPAIVAAITGIAASDTVRLCAMIQGDKKDGTAFWVVERAVGAFGWDLVYRRTDDKVRLGEIEPLCLSIVDAGEGHYVLTEDGWLVDTGNQTPVKIETTRFADSLIYFCWEVRRRV